MATRHSHLSPFPRRRPGYSAPPRSAVGVDVLVPRLVATLLPSARLLLLLRDPATVVRSRFEHCLRQPVGHRRDFRAYCGSSSATEYECMLLRSGILALAGARGREHAAGCAAVSTTADATPYARQLTPRALLDARMLPGTMPLVDDYVGILRRWSDAFPRKGAMLVLFTEQLASDAPSTVSRVLRFAGLPDFGWPGAVRVRGVGWTYSSIGTSKRLRSGRPRV